MVAGLRSVGAVTVAGAAVGTDGAGPVTRVGAEFRLRSGKGRGLAPVALLLRP